VFFVGDCWAIVVHGWNQKGDLNNQKRTCNWYAKRFKLDVADLPRGPHWLGGKFRVGTCNLDIEFNALFSGGCKTRNEMKLDLNQYRVQTKAYNFYIWKRSVGLLLKQIPNSKMDVLANHKKTWPDKLWLHVPTRNSPPNQCGPRGRSASVHWQL
jgi:hypothetical protein